MLLSCRRVTLFLQWLAASAAGLSEVEYVAFGDDSHGDIVSEFVKEIISLPPSRRTVRVPQCCVVQLLTDLLCPRSIFSRID